MKRVLTLLFIFSIGPVFAENIIIAVVNNSVVTYNSLELLLLDANSKDHKVDIINQRINDIIQLERAKDLGLEASLNDVNLALVEISKSNNISLEQILIALFSSIVTSFVTYLCKLRIEIFSETSSSKGKNSG